VVLGSVTLGVTTSVEEQAVPSSEHVARMAATVGMCFTSMPSGLASVGSLACGGL